MKFSEQLAEFKKKFLSFMDEPAAGDTAPADSLKDYATDSGTKLKIDKLEAGGKVYSEDGTTAHTSGFTLADGTVVAVDEAGTITAVTAPVADEPMAADPAALPAGFAERFAAMEKELAELKGERAAAQQNFSDALGKEREARAADAKRYSDALNGVVGLIEKFAEQPADDPAHAPSGATDVDGLGTKAQRAKRIISTLPKDTKIVADRGE